MGMTATTITATTATVNIDEKKYRKLLAKAMPKTITNDKQFDHMVEQMEELDRKPDATIEERELAKVLLTLIQAYDEANYPIPEVPPHKMIRYLMEQRHLKQADLVSVIGSRAQVSDLVNGKRGISKSKAKKLAEFFHVSAELFI
jgi:HTH-type transcriptional regulator/antitoxin HigA